MDCARAGALAMASPIAAILARNAHLIPPRILLCRRLEVYLTLRSGIRVQRVTTPAASASLQRRSIGHRERSTDGPKLSGESQLAREFELRKSLRRHLARCGEDADRDRKVEAAAFLGKPAPVCTSTRTRGASRPASARLKTTARDMHG